MKLLLIEMRKIVDRVELEYKNWDFGFSNVKLCSNIICWYYLNVN